MNTKTSNQSLSNLGQQLQTSFWAKTGELVVVFLPALGFITLMSPWVEDNLILKQSVVWIANVMMLILVWVGLRLRGEHWSDLGLRVRFTGWKNTLKVFLQSFLVFVLALVGFLLGSMIMVNLTGMPQQADMSGYGYLQDNLGLFLLTLVGVLFVSSFGEEVIYRGFLINRLTQLGSGSRRSVIIAVVVSAIIFGLIHYEWGATGIVQTGFMGLALGFSYILLKKRLIILILAHAYMDILLMVQLYLTDT